MKIRLKKDDRYDITRRNEVGRRNTTEVSGDNRYTEETRRILEKLGRLATAVANHFGWDPEIVMRDFVKDLAIINNPALIAELDTNNPIDQMTDQLMRMYLADEEAFNIFRNTALAQIMNMSEERAIRTLEQILGRGQISTSRTNQFIGNRNARRIGHNDSNFEETWNYEGWYVEDIIDELEPEFEMIENGEATHEKFKTAGDLKQWIKSQYPLNNATKVEGFDTAVSCVLRHFNQRVMNEFGGYTNYPLNDSFETSNALEQLKRLKTKYNITEGYKKETDEGYFEIVEKDKNNPIYSDIMYGIDEEAQVIDETKDYIMVFWRKYDKGHDPRDFDDSQSQEIAREYQRLSEKYDLDFEDLVYGEDGFMNSCYPNDFPDFKGDVIFSEKYWNEFEKWLKETKGIELEHDNSDFLTDSKEDKQRFIAKFGEDAFNRYNRISQKLQGQYKDMTWLTANVEANELNEIFNNAEFKGYEPTDENEDFVMFKIENLDMCQKLSEGANWCIAKPEAYNTYANYGAEYKFYINKKTGEKYCVASVSGMNEIVDQNNNELAKLPDGVPGETYTSDVVRENKTSSEATLETALRHIELLSIAQLRTAYNDLFGDELSLLEDDEVKSWLTAKLPEVDTNDLKRYIEQHLDAFAVLPQVGEEDFDEDDFDEEDFDEDDFDEDDFDEDNYDDEDLVEDSYITDVITETEVETLTADLKAYLASYNEVKVDSWFNDDNVIMILTITGDDKDEILNYIDDFDEDWDWDDNDQIVAKGQPQPVLNKESVLQHIINKYKLNDFRNKQFKISNEASKQGQIEDTDFSNMKFKITDMGKEFYNETEFEAKGTFEIMVDIPFEKKN